MLSWIAFTIGHAASSMHAPYVDVFGTDAVQCSGALLVRTDKSLIVFAICAPNGLYPSKNLSISLRRSVDWGATWLPAVPQPFPIPSLPRVLYDFNAHALVAMGACKARERDDSDHVLRTAGCPPPATCSWRSTDEGTSWSGPTLVGSYGAGEGCGGFASSASGNLLMPTGMPNCTEPAQPTYDTVLISADGGATWDAGGATPLLPTRQGWGECMVAELSNGSTILTSRLSSRVPGGRHTAPIQTAFAISHDGARTWQRAWTFPAGQPFDSGFGPGYNVEHALIAAHNRTRLLLSKPTATLGGHLPNGTRADCAAHTQGSCWYRRNLTIAHSPDGGASWSVEDWGLVYPWRVAYSDMVELPDGRVAVVFERGNPDEEYRHLSVAIVTPPWARAKSALGSAWRGVDMSQLSTEDGGGASPPFRATAGGPKEDALHILRGAGANAFRMRLWNDPCADGRCNSTRYAYGGLDGALAMARRCAAANLSFVLDLHYSDWWADPAHQNKPTAWKALGWSDLRTVVWRWTRDTVAAFVAQGTPPVTVQVGNEISNGFLWPESGSGCASGAQLYVQGCDGDAAWARLGVLVAQGIWGVRNACPRCEVAIHTDLGNHLQDRGVGYVQAWYANLTAALKAATPTPATFDRIGLSLYPQWDGGQTLHNLKKLASLAAAFPSQRIYVAETAYPAEGGKQPEVDFPATPAGQLAFLQAVFAGLEAAVGEEQNGGVLWWEGSEGGDWQSLFDDEDVARPALLEGFKLAS